MVKQRILEGKSIYGGIAIGTIHFFGQQQSRVEQQQIKDTEAEIARFQAAKTQAMEELGTLYDKAVLEVGEENAQIFESHSVILQDHDYLESIYRIIRTQQVNAAYAVAVTEDNFSNLFSKMKDEYFKARFSDVKDISQRLIAILTSKEKQEALQPNTILVAEDLSPSETVQLDKSCLLGLVTKQGSDSSHTAILARTMNLPAVIHIAVSKEWEGETAILDGIEGRLILSPTKEVLLQYQQKLAKEQEKRDLLEAYKGKPTMTKSGRRIFLCANIGSTLDLPSVLENDGEGIGLFRSEFLYLTSQTFPSEERQFQAYKQAAEAMAGRQVIIRTLDIGADKQAAYFGLEEEQNPSMGCRAIRICLRRPELFKTQLRAILRASAFGNVAIMYPMITSVWEVRRIKELVEEAKKELDQEGIDYGKVKQGIMIETPAAAIISDLLAKEVDFFSIGTNDLTQYTMAIDRQNAKLDEFMDPHHEAIMRLIQMTVHNGHEAGIWVGICGELGSDLTLIDRFLAMGVDELSVSPSSILPVRKAVWHSEA